MNADPIQTASPNTSNLKITTAMTTTTTAKTTTAKTTTVPKIKKEVPSYRTKMLEMDRLQKTGQSTMASSNETAVEQEEHSSGNDSDDDEKMDVLDGKFETPIGLPQGQEVEKEEEDDDSVNNAQNAIPRNNYPQQYSKEEWKG